MSEKEIVEELNSGNWGMAPIYRQAADLIEQQAKEIAELKSAILEIEKLHHFFADEVEYFNRDEERRADEALRRYLPLFRLADRPTGKRFKSVKELMEDTARNDPA